MVECKGQQVESETQNHADIQVYWYGACDMWIDYVRVDNDVADELFKGVRDPWIQDEVEQIGLYKPDGVNPAGLNYYIELTEFNNIPCIAYVNRKIKQYSLGTMCVSPDWYVRYSNHLPWADRSTVMTAEHIKRFWVDSLGLNAFYAENYPYRADVGDPAPSTSFSKIPNTLPKTSCVPTTGTPCGMLGYPVSPSAYDNYLQDNMDHQPEYYSSNVSMDETARRWDRGEFRFIMKLGNSLSKMAHIPFIHMPAAHLWYNPTTEIQREPTNEELDLQSNLAVSYGARGLMYWWFPSWPSQPGQNIYNKAIAEPNGDLRLQNVYEEVKTKKQTFVDIVSRTKLWEQHLLSFDYDNTNSYIYYNETERNSLLLNSYFADVVSYKPGNTQPQCWETDVPESTYTGPGNPSLIYDCNVDRYFQVATFKKNPDDGNKYFMLVNRRCSPYINDNDEDHRGGRRYMRVRFKNDNSLPTYDSWNIIDLENPRQILTTFSKSANRLVDLGWYNPGAGKLYELVPVMKGGGTLAGDENLSGVSFTCEDTVFNGGHNITIGANTSISFTDTSKIIMNGGTFTAGDVNVQGSQGISFGATGTNPHWFGYDFNNCNVQIYNTEFNNIANDTNFAVNIIDCPLVDIRNNTFNSGSDNLKGGINAVYYTGDSISNIYIGGNEFSSANSTVPELNFMSYAGTTLPVIIENNTFSSSSTSGSTAMLLSGLTGGAVKSNTINNFDKSISLLSTSVDVYGNTITSDVSGAIGIFGAGSSEIKMNPSGSIMLGGLNTITNTGTSARNIYVDNSYFYLDQGENVFDLNDENSGYHLNGFFPYHFFTITQYETYNCFKLRDAPVTQMVNVTNGDGGDQLSFLFTPYLTNCDPSGPGGFESISLGNGIYDSVGTVGNGGGSPPMSVSQRHAFDLQRGVIIITPKQIYDSICILMRHHNYAIAKNRCYGLIDTYPDSMQSLAAISKLFLALTASDTTSASMTSLKTYYENLILNHSNNTVLVQRCNYFVQKCKVRMHQYTAAMAGFQEIINQNPYSYEGLLARWDYMATSLLMNGGGQGGESIENYELGITNEEIYDSGDPFTKEQRINIKKTINIALETTKKRDEDKIKILETKANNGDEKSKYELKTLNTLKQVIKTQKPKNVFEHIKIVSNDIQKIFGGTGATKKGKENLIPVAFKLYQNYPNPFNPIAVIKYDIPQNSKVLIKVYDLLGREVKQLVDEFKQAGSYTINFDGTNLASGVYFYRIEVRQGESSTVKYLDSKKMVLVK